MLQTPNTFPYPGAHCFMRPDAAPVRIIRTNLDGTAFVALQPGAAMPAHQARQLRTIASGNTTVPLTDLAETAEEAIVPVVPAKAPTPPAPRRARKRRSRKAA